MAPVLISTRPIERACHTQPAIRSRYQAHLPQSIGCAGDTQREEIGVDGAAGLAIELELADRGTTVTVVVAVLVDLAGDDIEDAIAARLIRNTRGAAAIAVVCLRRVC